MCDHKNIVLTAEGWFCPDCQQVFKDRPKAEKPKAAAKPKKESKPKAKSTTKK